MVNEVGIMMMVPNSLQQLSNQQHWIVCCFDFASTHHSTCSVCLRMSKHRGFPVHNHCHFRVVGVVPSIYGIKRTLMNIVNNHGASTYPVIWDSSWCCWPLVIMFFSSCNQHVIVTVVLNHYSTCLFLLNRSIIINTKQLPLLPTTLNIHSLWLVLTPNHT